MAERKKAGGPSARRAVSNNLFILKAAFKAAPLTTAWSLLEATRYNVIVYFEHTYQIVYLIDCVQFNRPFSYALRFVLTMTSIVCANMLAGRVFDSRIVPKGREKINRALREMLYAKATEIDIWRYDDPNFYNDYVFAMQNATERADAVIKTASRIIGSLAFFAVVGGYFFLNDPVGIAFVAVSFVSNYFLRKRTVKLRFGLDRALNALNRKRDYINRVFYLPDYVKEMRLSRVKERLLEDYAETEENVYAELKTKSKKIAALEFARHFAVYTFLYDCVLLLYLMFQAIVRGALSFGALYGLYRSVGWARGVVEGFSQSLADIFEHSLYVDKVRAFLDCEQNVVSPDGAKAPGRAGGALEIKNVSFSYPSAGETGENLPAPALGNINLTVKKGEKIAFVGYNGAGKTTLVKLIMRLYEPDAGEILYDGINIRDYCLEGYRSLFSTLFQDYQIYAATVAENVAAGQEDSDPRRVVGALESSGLAKRVGAMPDKIGTQLTREFTKGEELSGGERQKLALARCLYPNCPLIILDEPSSSLDPIAEYETNNMMQELGRDKTVIFISHRLSTTKRADRICMFDGGRLVEEGTHEELLRLGGRYAEMFALQAEKYN